MLAMISATNALFHILFWKGKVPVDCLKKNIQ